MCIMVGSNFAKNIELLFCNFSNSVTQKKTSHLLYLHYKWWVPGILTSKKNVSLWFRRLWLKHLNDKIYAFFIHHPNNESVHCYIHVSLTWFDQYEAFQNVGMYYYLFATKYSLVEFTWQGWFWGFSLSNILLTTHSSFDKNIPYLLKPV